MTLNNRSAWSVSVFNNLYVQSPRRAFEYRRDTLWDPIPEEYLTDEEKEALNLKEETLVEETEKSWDDEWEETENSELTREETVEILEKNNIEYVKNSKTETLLKKAIEHNLI